MAFVHHEISIHRQHQSRILRLSQFSLWVLSFITYLKHHLSDFNQVFFFRYLGCRKWDRMASRQLETSLHRLHQRRFLGVQNVDYEILWSFAYLKHHLSDFIQVDFSMIRMQKLSSNDLLTLSNIESSISPKSFLRLSDGRYWIPRAFRLLKTSLLRHRPKRFFYS
jgi:hypothetical protein